MLKKKQRLTIYLFSLAIYFLFTLYNFLASSDWLFDSTLSMALITAVFMISRWIKLDKFEFMMINLALIIHNLGTFDFYEWHWWIIQYDHVVHFAASAVSAYIIFDFLARKLHIKEKQRRKHTVIDENKAIFITLAISIVVLLGTAIELIEFAGFTYLREGGGILFPGSGDSVKIGDPTYQYIDTMSDIITNVLGSISGVLYYYFTQYKRKPWLKY
ncbi:hypothetical protein GF323_03400 [Candidatus Woesearchaeota archaeon]|nr:hypothetical protein [Candidatus Woesearchaeota archaeon]